MLNTVVAKICTKLTILKDFVLFFFFLNPHPLCLLLGKTAYNFAPQGPAMEYYNLEGWISSISLLRFWLDWGNGEEDNREIVSSNKTDGWG